MTTASHKSYVTKGWDIKSRLKMSLASAYVGDTVVKQLLDA